MTGRVTRILAVVLLAGAFPIGVAAPVAAEEPSTYGWWYRLNLKQARNPLGIEPTHPGVPDDGLFVARDLHPDEPLAISALNYLAPSGAGAVLELKVEPNTVAGIPEIAACPVTAAFFGDSSGFWEDRPLPDCRIAVDGELVGSPTPTSIVWRLTEDFEVFPEFWNFVLTPTENTTEEPFQVAFQRPGPSSFSVLPSNDLEGEPEEPLPLPPPPDDGAFDFVPPVTFFEPSEPFEPPVAEALPEPGPTPAPQQVTRASAPLRPPDDTAERFIAAAVLIAIALALASLQFVGPRARLAAATGGAPETEPTPEGTIRGLGRFARPRAGPPRQLL